MARIDIKSTGTTLDTGILQLENGVAMDATLRKVADQNNTVSPLKLSTALVQTTSTLKITTADNPYIDAEDNSGNNRFTVGRATSSQQVNVDFASNPTGSTTAVGAIRTYQDGVNLSEAMTFIEDGSVGIGTTAPVGILHIKKTAANTRLAIDGDAGFNRLISYRTNAVQRFGLYTNNTAESGSNVGSDFAIRAYSDAGTLLNTPVFIKRSTGNVGINTLTGTAKLQVVGSGSTSATTSLLVQNSAGTAALTVDDSRNTVVNGQFDVTGISNFRVVTTASTVSLRIGSSPAISYNASEMYFAGSQFYFQLGTDFRFAGRGIFGAQTFNATAQLQVDSTTKGFLPPRMTTAEKLAITTPAAGLMVYDTTLNKLCVYTGAGWETITSI